MHALMRYKILTKRRLHNFFMNFIVIKALAFNSYLYRIEL
jgi:hypothetical protein